MFEVDRLCVSYGQSQVVNEVSFQAAPNETVALMGRNGMGKSTLFKALMGVLPARSGAIRLEGAELAGLPSHRRVQRGMAYVPQGRMIFPALTVMENIQTGLEKSGTNRVPDELFELFPVLFEMRHRKGGNLSGGQQQQLALARALATDPSVLLLDEPTEGIQPSIIKEIAYALNEIRKLRRITLIVSEQVLSFALTVADRILVLERGCIIHEDRREDADIAKITGYLSV